VILVLTALDVLLFPALALWAWRAGGAARLWQVTGLGLGLILLFAAVVASAPGGNVLAPVYGYRYTVSRVLGLYGVTLGLPLVAAALVIRILGDRWGTRRGLYGVAALGAALMWIGGVLVAAWVLWLSPR
jgi:hypothetical protein